MVQVYSTGTDSFAVRVLIKFIPDRDLYQLQVARKPARQSNVAANLLFPRFLVLSFYPEISENAFTYNRDIKLRVPAEGIMRIKKIFSSEVLSCQAFVKLYIEIQVQYKRYGDNR